MTSDTSTHQDHVIAHVIGATVIGHFVWDESIYLLLDIGFAWRIYLDCEMGLVPIGVAIDEVEAEADLKQQLKADADVLLSSRGDGAVIKHPPVECLIEEVTLTVDGDERTLTIAGEDHNLVVHTSISSRAINLFEA
jgi:hypothetical protein